MDIGQIEKVMQLMQSYGFNEVEWEKGEEKLRLVHHAQTVSTPMAMPNLAHAFPANLYAQPTAPQNHRAPEPQGAPSSPSSAKSHLKEIRSPFVGTYYSAATPGSDPFVEVGKRVRKGDTLCIVEAMKLMNEIEAEKDGVIVEILVSNEEPVEFDQVLFLME